MTHFPLFTDIGGKTVIIFGGGAHAEQRVEKLLPFSPRLVIISERISEKLKAEAAVECIERPFCERDLLLEPVFVVIAEDEERTALIYEACHRHNILVNAADRPSFCDIIFPSYIATEHLCVAISSGGISPTATVEYKKRIGEMIPDGIDDILLWMGEVRIFVNATLEPSRRRGALRALFCAALDLGRPLDDRERDEVILGL